MVADNRSFDKNRRKCGCVPPQCRLNLTFEKRLRGQAKLEWAVVRQYGHWEYTVSEKSWDRRRHTEISGTLIFGLAESRGGLGPVVVRGTGFFSLGARERRGGFCRGRRLGPGWICGAPVPRLADLRLYLLVIEEGFFSWGRTPSASGNLADDPDLVFEVDLCEAVGPVASACTFDLDLDLN